MGGYRGMSGYWNEYSTYSFLIVVHIPVQQITLINQFQRLQKFKNMLKKFKICLMRMIWDTLNTTPTVEAVWWNICNMIKGKEWHVANIDCQM